MKKAISISFLILLLVGVSAFAVHKFYVSIYQINYAQEKKMLQITSRIFADDMNDILKKKLNKTTHIGEPNESPDDILLMKKYILDHLIIKINGQQKAIEYLSKEMEGNVVISYFRIKDISKIKTFEIQNTTLFDLNEEQQNIIQTNIYGKKESLLLTSSNVKGLLKQ